MKLSTALHLTPAIPQALRDLLQTKYPGTTDHAVHNNGAITANWEKCPALGVLLFNACLEDFGQSWPDDVHVPIDFATWEGILGQTMRYGAHYPAGKMAFTQFPGGKTYQTEAVLLTDECPFALAEPSPTLEAGIYVTGFGGQRGFGLRGPKRWGLEPLLQELRVTIGTDGNGPQRQDWLHFVINGERSEAFVKWLASFRWVPELPNPDFQRRDATLLANDLPIEIVSVPTLNEAAF